MKNRIKIKKQKNKENYKIKRLINKIKINLLISSPMLIFTLSFSIF
jgi:hypothetical protein